MPDENDTEEGARRDEGMPTDTTRVSNPAFSRSMASDVSKRYGLLIAWIGLAAVFSILRPDYFLTFQNMSIVFGSQSVLLVLSLGLLVPFAAGEYDLSIAGVLGLSLVLVGDLNVIHHWPILAAIAVALGAGLVVGIVNALFVVVIGIDSIVVTLGIGTLLAGIGFGLDINTVGGISNSLVGVVRYDIFGLPMAFFFGVAMTLMVWYVFAFTPLGRYLYFVGAGREVARLSGLRVNAIRAGALIASALISALAGVIEAGWLGASDPNVYSTFLLPAFAAAFLGATAITPGRFNPVGTFIAVYFLVTGITGLELLGYIGWVEQVFYGASLVLAVAFSHFAGTRLAKL